jgi:hypothetical protein
VFLGERSDKPAKDVVREPTTAASAAPSQQARRALPAKAMAGVVVARAPGKVRPSSMASG